MSTNLIETTRSKSAVINENESKTRKQVPYIFINTQHYHLASMHFTVLLYSPLPPSSLRVSRAALKDDFRWLFDLFRS